MPRFDLLERTFHEEDVVRTIFCQQELDTGDSHQRYECRWESWCWNWGKSPNLGGELKIRPNNSRGECNAFATASFIVIDDSENDVHLEALSKASGAVSVAHAAALGLDGAREAPLTFLTSGINQGLRECW